MDYLQESDAMRFSPKEIDRAIENILLHQQAVTKFSDLKIHKAYNQTFTEDFLNYRLPGSLYKKCKFEGVKLTSVSFNSSQFAETLFDGCEISDTGMQSSSFSDVTFDRCLLSGSNMSQCFLWNTVMRGTKVCSTSMLQSVIADSRIIDCEMSGVSLESCTISNVFFQDVRLANLHMEYSEFDRIRSDNAVYPFAQLPYIFGGLQYVMNTSDAVGISSKKNNADQISIEEYRQCLRDMMIFFWSRKEYFPLANICHCLDMNDKTRQIIRQGVFSSLQNRDFRMLKYFCKLASNINLYTQEDMKGIYRDIESTIDPSELSEDEYYRYCLHLTDIQRLLLDNGSQYPTFHITLTTNIDSRDMRRLAVLLEIFSGLLDLFPPSQLIKRIELRHNSNFIVDFIQSGALETIFIVISLFGIVLNRSGKAADDAGKIISLKYRSAEHKREDELHSIRVEREKQEIRHQRETHERDMKLKDQQIELNALQIKAAEDKAIEGIKRLQDENIQIIKVNPIIYSPSGRVLDGRLLNDLFKGF